MAPYLIATPVGLYLGRAFSAASLFGSSRARLTPWLEPMPRARVASPAPATPPAAAPALLSLLGTDLPATVAGLTPERILGPWPGRAPADRRPRVKFASSFYPPDHAHPHAEVCLLLDGTCQFSLAGHACALRPGDLVWVPPGVAHAESWHRPALPYRIAWLILNATDPCLQLTRYQQGPRFTVEHRLSLATLPAEARARVETLAAWAAAPAPPPPAPLQEACATLTLALLRRVLAGGGEGIDARGQVVERTLARLRAGSGPPPGVGELSRAAHLSPNYLSALCKTHTGHDLRTLVVHERIQRADTLLRTTTLPLKAIAAELGFSDPFTFSRAYKRVTGRPPTATRRA
jgi:AraC-like DNA-binding protein